MRVRSGVVLYATIVIATGLLTLVGLLVGDGLGLLSQLAEPVRGVTALLVRLVVLVVAFTLLIGVFNLFYVHVTRLVRGRSLSARLTSMVLLLSFVLALVLWVYTPESRVLLQETQVAIESSLAALICFALVFGALRVLRRRLTWPLLLFLLGMLVVLVAALPLPALAPLSPIFDWLVTVPVGAGARGILLGIALATLVVGLRVVIGQDRTYGD